MRLHAQRGPANSMLAWVCGMACLGIETIVTALAWLSTRLPWCPCLLPWYEQQGLNLHQLDKNPSTCMQAA